MNTDQVKQLIQNIGLMTEIYMITYGGFKKQGLNDKDALMHTKTLISAMMETFVTPNGGDTEEKG